ncbi:DUF2945 domain-containing protein [Rhizobium sp. 2YAF20]|uniref:DUF2945 domain-containing protein n=1 Tax=Rhizobium sp. 2YAF20 TaxID=3233027 RepID=UPI003F9A5572
MAKNGSLQDPVPQEGLAPPLAMTKRLEVGDRASWNSEAGRVTVTGTIIAIHTQNIEYKAHTHYTSPQSPHYEIKSSKTYHVALHRGQVLTRLSD